MQLASIQALTKFRSSCRSKTEGFVPTMGALHAGHQSLIQLAVNHCDVVIVSIFVNPTQFAPHEDFDQYPRALDDDLKKCIEWGASAIFTPQIEDVYPESTSANYTPSPNIAEVMCGKSRPHFFYGVCNVVERLFALVRPTHAFFGDKDVQQRVIIERMVNDLDLNINIIAAPIVRDENGMALSSRNQYLDNAQYEKSLVIFKTLHDASIKARDLAWGSYQIRQFVAAQIEARGLKGDYVEIFRPSSGEIISGSLKHGDYCCVAVFCGDTRLIDNRKLNL